jgi:hypothetical protein
MMPGMEPGMMPGMMPGMEGPGMMPGMMPGGRGESNDFSRVKLFRFLDFTVQPGQRYKYRVRLLLSNPNYGLPTRFLENEDLAKAQWLETDWCEVSNTVTIPRDSRVLASTVTSSRYITVEPKATVGIAYFEMNTGAQQFDQFEVTRGQLLNYLNRPAKSSQDMPGGSPAGPMPMEEAGLMPLMPGMEGPPMPGAKGATKKKEKHKKTPSKDKAAPEETVDYITDSLVLDLRGGNKLPGKDREATEPGRMLLLDAEGRLVTLNELDDQKEFKAYAEPSQKRPGMEGMPMMPGMEGPMPGAMPMDMMTPGALEGMTPGVGGHGKPAKPNRKTSKKPQA